MQGWVLFLVALVKLMSNFSPLFPNPWRVAHPHWFLTETSYGVLKYKKMKKKKIFREATSDFSF